jgi:hypothetical protein
MMEPRLLTTLLAPTACYRNSFNFFYHRNYNRQQEAMLTDPHTGKLFLYLITHKDMKTWGRKYSFTIFDLGTSVTVPTEQGVVWAQEPVWML